jgi:hypothetical protein
MSQRVIIQHNERGDEIAISRQGLDFTDVVCVLFVDKTEIEGNMARPAANANRDRAMMATASILIYTWIVTPATSYQLPFLLDLDVNQTNLRPLH